LNQKNINSNKYNVKEWADYYGDVTWVNDVLWHRRNKIFSPIQMSHTNLAVDRKELRRALSNTKALLAHCTDDWDRD
jgi:hypothetical protein